MTHPFPISERDKRRAQFERRKRKHPRDLRHARMADVVTAAPVPEVEPVAQPLAFATAGRDGLTVE